MSVYFPIAMLKYSAKCNFKGETADFIHSSRLQSITGVSQSKRELERAGHITSAVSAESNEGIRCSAQLTIFTLISPGTPA